MADLGRYQLGERLGQGGMATVFRARDPQLGRDVAIKVMHPFIAEKSEAARRFEREARAVAGLRHPNILQLHDYQPAEGEQPAYLVMELLGGPSLRSFLEHNGTPFSEVGAIIGLRVAQALEAAHQQGIVHRDVKPENVMFDQLAGNRLGTASPETPRLAPLGSPLYRVVLCDFGIARLGVEVSTMTATGAVIGSPVFMSPEQARGESVDARSDLFSLGSLLYALSTGTPPFVATQPLAILNKISKGDHSPPTAKNPRVPRWLERTIEKCLQVDPAARFQTAAQVVEALGDGLRADGFGDFDGELATYLKDPPAYNERFAARVVAASLEQMRRALEARARPRALAAASRILAWEPAHAEAMGIVDKLAVRERRWWIAAVGVMMVAALSVGGWSFFRKPPPPPMKVEAPPPMKVEAPPPPMKVEAPPPAKIEAPPPPKKKVKTKLVEPAKLEAPPPQLDEPKVEEPPAPKADEPGQLTVAITPWCDLSVDGKSRGRAPMQLSLPPGTHHVECRQPSGAQVVRDVTVEPGKSAVLRERLFAAVSITPRLTPGTGFAVDEGAAGAGTRQATPGRHRITLSRDGKAVETRWIDVKTDGCVLVDTPELACEKP